MKIYMIKLTDEDHKEIKSAAVKMDLSMKELIVKAVKELLKNERQV